MKTEPNWTEAPEGANLFWTNPFSYSPWFKIEKGMLYNFDNLDRMWSCMEDIKHRFKPDSFIERPTVNHQLTAPVVNQEFTTEDAACSKMEPTAWNGKGLPPVGMACEYSIVSGKYKTGTFVGINSRKSFVIENESGELLEYHDYQIRLRPIKTDRERWIEAVHEAMEEQTSLGVSDFQLGIIYDAGLAKLPE